MLYLFKFASETPQQRKNIIQAHVKVSKIYILANIKMKFRYFPRNIYCENGDREIIKLTYNYNKFHQLFAQKHYFTMA